ncbi:hypothetical protein D3C85_1158820 [compost metagenome]
MLRRFDDDGVAGSQRRRHLPCRQRQRRIPGSDGHHHAQGLVLGVVEYARLVHRHHVPAHLVRQTGVVVEPLRDVQDLAAHFGNELAVVALLDPAQVIGVIFDQRGQLAQQGRALRRREFRPCAGGVSRMRGLDRAVRIDGRAARDTCPDRAGVGFHGVEPFAGSRIGPFAVDVELIAGRGLLRGVHAVCLFWKLNRLSDCCS